MTLYKQKSRRQSQEQGGLLYNYFSLNLN
jgi:hypothetical protein